MIASIHGKLTQVGSESVVILVGGLGLQVFVPTSTLNALSTEVGQPVSLQTYLSVKEDALTLFGFSTDSERYVFEQLLSVSGIGPRIALAALSTLTPETLVTAVRQDEPEIIARVPGIGKKTAQKLILELKDRLRAVETPEGIPAVSETDTEVIAALTALGYSIVEAQAALQAVPRDAPDDIEERIRFALSYFSE
ncbi:MAG: Holliday junction branch migration protein RuvA [Chloroflexi bacterium]|nr:Holliday junction branch migration protein RuvA [Chloroflexota bacterium]